VASSGRRQRLVIRRAVARNDPNIKLRSARAERRTTRQQAIPSTVSEAVATQAPWRHTARNNPMLEGEAVQASSIELLGEASSWWRFELRRSVPRMRTPPHNFLPSSMVDGWRVTCHLTLSTTWGSPTSLVGMVESGMDIILRPTNQKCQRLKW
jgi:hypothetical protein